MGSTQLKQPASHGNTEVLRSSLVSKMTKTLAVAVLCCVKLCNEQQGHEKLRISRGRCQKESGDGGVLRNGGCKGPGRPAANANLATTSMDTLACHPSDLDILLVSSGSSNSAKDKMSFERDNDTKHHERVYNNFDILKVQY